MLDGIVVVMLGVTVAMAIGIAVARYGGHYRAHWRIQLGIAVLLAITVTAFEIDVRLINPHWRELAAASPYYASGLVTAALCVHLVFAIPTPLLWIYVIVAALRRFPNPPAPNEHSRAHRRWARLAALGMFGTTVTGWVFYWLAFVA